MGEKMIKYVILQFLFIYVYDVFLLAFIVFKNSPHAYII